MQLKDPKSMRNLFEKKGKFNEKKIVKKHIWIAIIFLCFGKQFFNKFCVIYNIFITKNVLFIILSGIEVNLMNYICRI